MSLNHVRMILSASFAAAIIAASATTIVRAADPGTAPPASSTTSPPWQITNDDLVVLFKAYAFELSPNSGKVVVEMVNASRMPAYDPITYYAGIQSDGKPHILATSTPPKEKAALQDAISRAMILAVMDDGEAGAKWKSIYDLAAKADAALPAGSPDPYMNRRELAKRTLALLKTN